MLLTKRFVHLHSLYDSEPYFLSHVNTEILWIYYLANIRYMTSGVNNSTQTKLALAGYYRCSTNKKPAVNTAGYIIRMVGVRPLFYL
jgi:hypothetical protein